MPVRQRQLPGFAQRLQACNRTSGKSRIQIDVTEFGRLFRNQFPDPPPRRWRLTRYMRHAAEPVRQN
jgi:hypothetical protein